MEPRGRWEPRKDGYTARREEGVGALSTMHLDDGVAPDSIQEAGTRIPVARAAHTEHALGRTPQELAYLTKEG